MLSEKRYGATVSWVRRNPRRFLTYVTGGALALTMLIQFFYPSGSLLPFSTIDGVELGASSKQAAIKVLDEKFSTSKVSVYLNNSDTAFFDATPGDLGITSSNKDRIEAISYPWYLRIVPSSLFWAHAVTENVTGLQYGRDQDKLSAFLTTTFGDTCHLDVRNATVEVKDTLLVPTNSYSGGDCHLDEVTSKLSSAAPTINGAKVSISGDETKPEVTTAQAQTLATHVTDVIKNGIAITNGKDDYKVPKDILRTWLDFGIVDGKLDYSFSVDRSKSYLGERVAAEVEKPTGETVVTLKNFAEVSRTDAQSGVVFNQAAMLSSIKTSLEKGDKKVAVEVTNISPTVTFKRTFSPDDTALNALIKKYADSHPGTYGVSLRELSGDRRSASYRSTTQYTTASTYKMFVAYSTLLRVESGQWHWTDQINGGRDLTKCFNDMIQLSDNECAVALLKKVTAKSVTDEAHSIGATHTSFLVTNSIKSTPEDESLLLGLLESGQILKEQANRDIWINAMKKNVYRAGIPTGIPSATVADKVGFLDAWLHDAAIVYSPKGTYVLVIMTENSSWANIAELAGQIEKLR